MPNSAALSRSDWRAILLRSRQVSWKMGVKPLFFRVIHVARLPKRMTEDWLSVTLIAVVFFRYLSASSKR